jgi:ketosteroid isomerase-like protein
VEDEVLAANGAFYRAFRDKSYADMLEVWATSDNLSCVHPGWNLIAGRDAVLESWQRILGNPEQVRVVSGGATASVYGDVAVVACREFVAGTPLVATNVFVREGGRWRMLHHHSGPVFNA